MTLRIAILRPEPGNATTATLVAAAGLEPLILPLFAITPMPWQPPSETGFDGLLLTSANALRHGGDALHTLKSLPVLAVGPATATVARSASFTVEAAGESNAAILLAQYADRRLLWLAGRERTSLDHPAIAMTIAVYATNPIPLDVTAAAQLIGSVALLHSARAARQFATELHRHAIPRSRVRIAAISAAVAQSAGDGWDRIAIAKTPSDPALIAAARGLAIDP